MSVAGGRDSEYPTFRDAMRLYRLGEDAMRRADAPYVSFEASDRYRVQATALFAQVTAVATLAQAAAAAAVAVDPFRTWPEGRGS